MVKGNIAPAKRRLSELIRRTTAGEDVCVCRSGVSVVKLVPVTNAQAGSPCRVIENLTVEITGDVTSPLEEGDWGNLV